MHPTVCWDVLWGCWRAATSLAANSPRIVAHWLETSSCAENLTECEQIMSLGDVLGGPREVGGIQKETHSLSAFLAGYGTWHLRGLWVS